MRDFPNKLIVMQGGFALCAIFLAIQSFTLTIPLASAFQINHYSARHISPQPSNFHLQPLSQRYQLISAVSTAHFSNVDDNDTSENAVDSKSNNNSVSGSGGFDQEGFANYLAPYAVALLGAALVTAAFFKFVLLDY